MKTPKDGGLTPAGQLEQGQAEAQRLWAAFPRGRGPTHDSLKTLDHFAMAAMGGMLANPLNMAPITPEEVASAAYNVARAMMAERAK